MSPPVFRRHHRVRYADCTLGNHVYHARYLDLLDVARGEFFRSLGHPLRHLQEQDTTFLIVDYRLRYLSPASYDDELVITVAVAEMRRVRLGFSHHITREDGRQILEAEATYACTSVDGQPKRLPAGLVSALQPWLPAPRRASGGAPPGCFTPVEDAPQARSSSGQV